MNDEAVGSIVVITRDGRTRSTLERELRKRYGADYAVQVCAGADDVALDDGAPPVALFLAGYGESDPGGLDLLAELGRRQPGALRVAVVRWGDWSTAEPIFEAVTVGRLDRWLTAPQETPDEDFHRAVTEYLQDWAGRQGRGFQAVRRSANTGRRAASSCGTCSPATVSPSVSTMPRAGPAGSC